MKLQAKEHRVGLEVSCTYTFYGKQKIVDTLQDLLTSNFFPGHTQARLGYICPFLSIPGYADNPRMIPGHKQAMSGYIDKTSFH